MGIATLACILSGAFKKVKGTTKKCGTLTYFSPWTAGINKSSSLRELSDYMYPKEHTVSAVSQLECVRNIISLACVGIAAIITLWLGFSAAMVHLLLDEPLTTPTTY